VIINNIFQVWGWMRADDFAVLKIYCFEIQRSENRMANLADFSKEGYASKRALLPMMVMI
jgi:hypothetical protein